MKSFLKKYPQIIYFLWFIPVLSGYFVFDRINAFERIVIHSPLDELIPFVSFFSIPYSLWYVYIPGMLFVIMLFCSRDEFKKTCIALFSGMFIADLIFFFFPTCFPFRPENVPEIENLHTLIINIVYFSDEPSNVCPSLHVFEAVILHLAAFRQTKLGKHKICRLSSLVFNILVIMSTVFIKQHSVIDVVCGILLTVVIYFGVFYFLPLIQKGDSKFGKILTLFLTFFKIGAFTFGGGYAMIPLIQKEVVENKKWISEDDILDVIAISESTPGPIAINAATFIGYKIAGFFGAMFATLGVVLPSFIVISVVSLFLRAFSSYRVVKYAFFGIRAGVIALIVKALISMYKKCPKSIISYIIMLISFVLVLFTEISVIFVLLGCAVFALSHSLLSGRNEK